MSDSDNQKGNYIKRIGIGMKIGAGGFGVFTGLVLPFLMEGLEQPYKAFAAIASLAIGIASLYGLGCGIKDYGEAYEAKEEK